METWTPRHLPRQFRTRRSGGVFSRWRAVARPNGRQGICRPLGMLTAVMVAIAVAFARAPGPTGAPAVARLLVATSAHLAPAAAATPVRAPPPARSSGLRPVER